MPRILCYILLFLIIRPEQYMQLISNPVNGKEHPMLIYQKEKEKGQFWTLAIPQNREMGDTCIVVVSLTAHTIC